MGSKYSFAVCDSRLRQITKEILQKFHGKNYTLFHGRYRDDGFIIFHGNENEIHELLVIANKSSIIDLIRLRNIL